MLGVIQKFKEVLKKAYFWQRLTVLLVSSFLFSLFLRLPNEMLFTFFLLISFLAGIWLLLSLLKKRTAETLGKKPIKPFWVRLVATVTLVPALFALSSGLGFGLGLTINPYTAEEIAANEARAAAQAAEREAREAAEQKEREAREAAEQKEREAREAAEEAERQEQARQDELDRAAKESEEENQQNTASSSQESSPSPRPTEDARTQWEKEMEKEGWIEVQEGIWFSWAEDYTCGYFDCAYAFVAVEEVCSRGVYVEVTLEDDGVSIGRDIELTSSLVPRNGKLAQARLEFIDTSNTVTNWVLSKVFCRG